MDTNGSFVTTEGRRSHGCCFFPSPEVIFSIIYQEKGEGCMPIFEYQCRKCGVKFEELIHGDRNKTVPCPECGNTATEKLMSVIGGISMGGSKNAHCSATGCPGAAACHAGGGCPNAA